MQETNENIQKEQAPLEQHNTTETANSTSKGAVNKETPPKKSFTIVVGLNAVVSPTAVRRAKAAKEAETSKQVEKTSNKDTVNTSVNDESDNHTVAQKSPVDESAVCNADNKKQFIDASANGEAEKSVSVEVSEVVDGMDALPLVEDTMNEITNIDTTATKEKKNLIVPAVVFATVACLSCFIFFHLKRRRH
ncbi:hypothetical protein M9Y10_003203 [Tritrichomonas musculus]|uniref:Uncharacterized protein n=1 Tax=Tritrichomonas musculus TaxID=1915356 RepID=A0ABR2JP67_9EUKA